MSKDMVQMMNKLDFKKFFIAGHDRGGRVAHRLARDHGKKVIAMSVLDICPTLDMYEQTTKEFAKAYFHWFFLIQPKWFPEKIIKIDPRKWMKSCLDKWSGNHKFGKVEQEYLKSFKKIKKYEEPEIDQSINSIAESRLRYETLRKKRKPPEIFEKNNSGLAGILAVSKRIKD
jgi:hypothetical protein